MAKYSITFTCGHEETHQLFGRHREKERRIEWMENNMVCSECYKKQIQEARKTATATAIEAAAERGLPDLTGTEKQIAWAETLRSRILESIEKMMGDPELAEYVKFTREQVETVYQMISAEDSSRFWIDHRDNNIDHLVGRIIQSIPDPEKEAELKLKHAAEAEATLRPPEPKTETVARIERHERSITITFPEKRDDFREVVKLKLGFRWRNDCWSRPAAIKSIIADELIGYAGHKLLANGFIVMITDPDMRQAAIDGSIKGRWVVEKKGKFALRWERDSDLYSEAKRLTGSRWDKPFVTVPGEHFTEVLDFAEIHDFDISAGAKELAIVAEAEKIASLEVDVEETPAKKKGRPDLDIPDKETIDDEFRDDIDPTPGTQASAIAAAGFDPVALGGKIVDGKIFKPDADPNSPGECERCGHPGIWIAGAGMTLCHRHQDDY